MKKIKCNKCKSKMKVTFQGIDDQTTYKKLWRRTKRTSKGQGNKVFRWKKITKALVYKVIYKCECGEEFTFTGGSKAKTLAKINRIARR